MWTLAAAWYWARVHQANLDLIARTLTAHAVRTGIWHRFDCPTNYHIPGVGFVAVYCHQCRPPRVPAARGRNAGRARPRRR